MHLEPIVQLKGSGGRGPRRRPGDSPGTSATLVVGLLAVNYFIFFSGDESAPPATVVDGPIALAAAGPSSPGGALAAPGDMVDPTTRRDDFGDPVGRRVNGQIKRGQNILAALRSVGIDSHSARPLVRVMGDIFDFRKAQVGDAFSALIDDDGRVIHFEYTQSPLDIYEVILTEAGEYQARKKKVPTRVDIAQVGCAIRSNLYASLTRCGEGPELASSIIELLAWDIDFFQDLRDNDELKVIVEKISIDGKFLRYGRILAAEFRGKAGTHRIAHYRDPDGVEGYYKPDGAAARKDFIKSPLKYTRVASDSQSAVRTSLKTASAVTYTAAPKTSVQAVASGTIIAAGQQESGGFLVTIRHDNDFVSSYSLLGSLSPGITVGALVTQKTVIGKLGKKVDGADGAQMVFSLKEDGRYINPLTTTYAEGAAVSPDHRTHFEHTIDGLFQSLGEIPVARLPDQRT
jgi:murein DD-endopeptidase MepM/ murein hydrolase activator NlpD